VEPLVSKQWFVTMKPLAEKALQAVQDGEICIIPNRFEKVIELFPNSGDFFSLSGKITLYSYEHQQYNWSFTIFLFLFDGWWAVDI